jgi:hypothetical protein
MGTVFNHEGKTVIVVESSQSCGNCIFNGALCNTPYTCIGNERADGKNIRIEVKDEVPT